MSSFKLCFVVVVIFSLLASTHAGGFLGKIGKQIGKWVGGVSKPAFKPVNNALEQLREVVGRGVDVTINSPDLINAMNAVKLALENVKVTHGLDEETRNISIEFAQVFVDYQEILKETNNVASKVGVNIEKGLTSVGNDVVIATSMFSTSLQSTALLMTLAAIVVVASLNPNLILQEARFILTLLVVIILTVVVANATVQANAMQGNVGPVGDIGPTGAKGDSGKDGKDGFGFTSGVCVMSYPDCRNGFADKGEVGIIHNSLTKDSLPSPPTAFPGDTPLMNSQWIWVHPRLCCIE